MLRLAAAVAGYAAGQVGNGLGPVEAQCATWQAAEELTVIVAHCGGWARWTRLGGGTWPGDLAGAGVPRREIADRLGVTLSTVRGYLRGGSPRQAG